MTRAEILQAMQEIVNEITDIDISELGEDASIMDDLDMSSFEILMAVGRIEDACHVRFPEAQLREFITIGDLVDYVEAHAER